MATIDIILFCYNQEQYIEQALQSIYDQQVPADCSVRIIVADDCSPDNTLALIEKHAAESPFPIMFLPKEPNMGISKNYKRSFAATTADYVFILEGDDYWLQGHVKQHVDFLIAHPECSMVMSRIVALQQEKGIMQDWGFPYKSEYYLVSLEKQIADGNQLGNLSACSFRGQLLHGLPMTLFNIPIADWMLGVMMAEFGRIALLRDCTSIYRTNANSQWASKTPMKQLQILLRDARLYDAFHRYKYHRLWRQFKWKIFCEVRRNWMHYMPAWIQNTWHKIKSWIKN